MAKRQVNTAEKLLQHGLGLLSLQGMSGVTLGRLAEQVGMSKSGVFAHFSSIADVQLALLDYAAQIVAPSVIEPRLTCACDSGANARNPDSNRATGANRRAMNTHPLRTLRLNISESSPLGA